MEFGEISWVNTGVKSSSVHIPITQLDCKQFIIYPLLGSEKVGPAELKKREPINKTGGNWGEEGRLYPFSNLFSFPAPPTFRVPFTFGISPLSESLEKIQTRGWGGVLDLVWERFFFSSLLTTLIDFPTFFGVNIGTLAPSRTFLYCFCVHPSHLRLKIQLDGPHILRQMGTSTPGGSDGSGGGWESLIEPFLPFQQLGFAMSENRSLRVKLGNETGVCL